MCARLHQRCKLCPPLLKVAQTVLKDGFCTLRQAFDMTSANIPYDTNHAKQKHLQLPLAAIRIGKPGSGTAFTLLLEHYHGVDYKKMSVVLNGMVAHSQSDCSRFGKSMVKQLLGLAQSDCELECLRYAVFKASGMTPTQARQMYGFEHMAQKAKKVENCISEAQKIREAIETLTTIENTAFLATLGILPDDRDEVRL